MNGLIHTEQDTSSCRLCNKVCKSITEFSKLAKRINKVLSEFAPRSCNQGLITFSARLLSCSNCPFALQATDNTNHSWGIVWPQGAHTICLCSRLFWIYRLPHLQRYIADYVYKLMINKRWITLPVVYSRPFDRFWRSLSSPLTVRYNRRTGEESLFWKGSSAEAIFPPKIVSFRLQTSQQKGRKLHASPRAFRSQIHPKCSKLALEEN